MSLSEIASLAAEFMAASALVAVAAWLAFALAIMRTWS